MIVRFSEISLNRTSQQLFLLYSPMSEPKSHAFSRFGGITILGLVRSAKACDSLDDDDDDYNDESDAF